MKKIISKTVLVSLLCSMIVAVTTIGYPTLWKSVATFEEKGLPKSALKVVEKIYQKAKKEGNEIQQLKSLIHKSKYALVLEEDAQLAIVHEFKKEISNSQAPFKNVLECVLANLYWQYFQQNRYRFYERTSSLKDANTGNEELNTDFRTWSLPELYAAIHKRFQNALSNQEILKNRELGIYDEILLLQENSKIYRPTLLDFVAHNALKFYKTSENSITQTANQFEFTVKDFELTDDFEKAYNYNQGFSDNKLHAFKIYWDLLDFHKKKKNTHAFVMLELDRLEFIHKNLNSSDKDELLEAKLNELYTAYQNHEISSMVAFELANSYYKKSEEYTPENTQYQFEKKKSLEICRRSTARYTRSLGTKKCEDLVKTIKQTSFSLQTEKHLPICKNAKILLTYSNLDSIFLSVLKISDQQSKALESIRKNQERVTFINQLNKVYEIKQVVRNEQDYQKHSTEILIPQLDNGRYLLMVSQTPTLMNESSFATNVIQVTDFSLVEKSKTTQHLFQLINRNTGKPIEGAEILIKNEPKRTYSHKISKRLKTNQSGEFAFKTSNYHSQVFIQIKKGKQYALFENYYLNENRQPRIVPERTIIKPFIFTDRSIYRPSQTLHFKSILVEKSIEKAKTLKGQKLTATLFNVNQEVVDEKQFVTNEFGSIHGSFVLPGKGLTGMYRLMLKTEDQSTNEINISVEAYKRPKFEVSFKPIQKTYRLNDRIEVSALANAFGGSPVSNAKVTYRVYRKAMDWFMPYHSRWRPLPSSPKMELTHGETVTNSKGEFGIDFIAKPSLQSQKDAKPSFNFIVEASVTDLNGETRSAETNLSIGYQTLQIIAEIDEKIHANQQGQRIQIAAYNLNKEKVKAKGIVQIYKMIAPDRVLRKRPWKIPDYQNFSKETYHEFFPHEAYDDKETNPNLWEKGKLFFEKSVEIDGDKILTLPKIKNWPLGKYMLVVASQDNYQQKVRAQRLFTVLDFKRKTIAENALFEISTDKESYQPGEQVRLRIGSAAQEIHVTFAVEKNQQIVDQKIITLNNETKFLNFETSNQDLGGFAIKYGFSAYNQFYSGAINIPVAKKKDQIEIEVQTFRDKITPGKKEQWSFSIKGTKKDQAAAEFLASMYDVSLDQFKPHAWNFFKNQDRTYNSHSHWNAGRTFGVSYFQIYNASRQDFNHSYQHFDRLNWFGLNFNNHNFYNRQSRLVRKGTAGIDESAMSMHSESADTKSAVFEPKQASINSNSQKEEQNSSSQKQENMPQAESMPIKLRKNFNENAFFYPQLQTDDKGNIRFGFEAPEAYTRWKLQLLAHTKKAQFSYKELETTTQKELMLIPNFPRFVRHGDSFELRTKLANLTKKSMYGSVELKLYDALSGTEIMKNETGLHSFDIDASGNSQVAWSLKTPKGIQLIEYKIIAKSDQFSDGEQGIIPVLSNRKLATETLPMFVRGGESKSFELTKLKKNNSTSLQNHRLTLEITSNPTWIALQSLPYLMELPYECSEQVFARFYANSLAESILKSNPQVQKVFELWKMQEKSNDGAVALLSNLEKNEELSSILIEETPWLREATSEKEQKRRIGLLFDKNRVANEQKIAIEKLQEMQLPEGGFPWFQKSRFPNRYITQHIVTGLMQLQKLNGDIPAKAREIIDHALKYLDEEILNDYQKLVEKSEIIAEKEKGKSAQQKALDDFWSSKHLKSLHIQYLYLRSYVGYAKNSKLQKAIEYYHGQAAEYWKDFGLMEKAMIAISKQKNREPLVAQAILKSLKENSITSANLGMYWKENKAGWRWSQSPIETQAILIEAFAEIDQNPKNIEELKIWLLKNKQTNRWKSSKATSSAVYALLMNGSQWLKEPNNVQVMVGKEQLTSANQGGNTEAGTGYFKKTWTQAEISSEKADVTIKQNSQNPLWGGLYWQYFEDFENITDAQTHLQISKELFKKTNTDQGLELHAIGKDQSLNLGDLATIRLIIKTDRDLEFVHLKDDRSSCFEPKNVLSGYKYRDGFSYYESTKDASTNFFIDFLPKGIFVFEYDVRVNNTGDFSSGIATIQNRYAPEFSAHSKGLSLGVE